MGDGIAAARRMAGSRLAVAERRAATRGSRSRRPGAGRLGRAPCAEPTRTLAVDQRRPGARKGMKRPPSLVASGVWPASVSRRRMGADGGQT